MAHRNQTALDEAATERGRQVDSGTAGIVGALVGGTLTSVTALVSNQWTHRMAREQLEAQSHQADQQRRFDLRTELREPRQLAYSEFIAQAHRIQKLAGTTCRDSDEWKGRILPAVQELGKLGASVAVVGPAAVAASAAGFVQATIGLLRHTAGWVPSERSEDLAAAVALVAPLDAFIEAARKAYEDDGSNSA